MIDPFKKFNSWFRIVEKKNLQDPTAFALASSDKYNQPHVRMVLLKKIDNDGFVFFTNLKSNKGNQFKSNKKLSMCFYWESIGRQIRIIGKGEIIDEKKSDDYFLSRPLGSQIGAWASNQSRALESKEHLKKKYDFFKKRFVNEKIFRPKHWVGIKIKPSNFEFWKQGKYRLHSRENISLVQKKWKSKLLYP